MLRSLISLTLFIFGSANLYFTNITEFSFLFSKIWYYFLAVALVLLIVIFIFLQKFNNKYTKKITALFFAMGLLLWIQGNIIVWNYGPLDGQLILWGDFFWNGIVDVIVWIGITAIILLKSDSLYKHIRIVCIALIVVQFVGIMATVAAAPGEPAWKYPNSNEYPKELLQFSSENNTIIIIIDSYQSDIFQEIINEDERYRDMFDGFTYYRNAVGGFTSTFPTVPLILTGEYYDNSVPVTDFVRDTSLNHSIPVLLKQNGFRTSVSEYPSLIYVSHDVFDDISPVPYQNVRFHQDTKLDDARFLIDLTLFRHIPQPLKMILFSKPLVPYSGRLNQDLIMYQRFKADVTVGSPNATFKLIHLNGLHLPFTVNENLEASELPPDRTGYKATAKGALSITDALLTNLKQQGVYDNSLIFIVGDHGSHMGYVMGLNNSSTQSQEYSMMVSKKIVARGIPLILVKPINSTGNLSISDAPVTLGDIPKTIADSYGIANNFSGESILAANIDDNRTRMYYNFYWTRDTGIIRYLPTLTEYQITGFSWDPDSWKPTYRLFTPTGIQYNPPITYEPGTIIHFGTGGEAEQYLGTGWSTAEKGWRWTSETRSDIILPMKKPQSDLVLNLQFFPFLAQDTLDSQRLNISVNGNLVMNYTISHPKSQKIVVEIDRSLLNENSQTLTFDLPDARSPYETGDGNDIRTLGIAVQTLSLSEKKG